MTRSSSDTDSSTEKKNSSQEQSSNQEPDSIYAEKVKEWTIKVPIQFGLCPWAGKAHARGLLRYVTCEGDSIKDVIQIFAKEANILTSKDISPWSSTLIVCPHISAWNDFQVFEQFLQSDDIYDGQPRVVDKELTLVPFHPNFLRWYGIPKGLNVGSVVEAHWGMIGKKSKEKAQATIVETQTKAFGSRRVKVRFHDVLEGRRQEQYIPIDWIHHHHHHHHHHDSCCQDRPILPDNFMHRTPYPTIHLIRNADLASMSIRDISRVKRKNAERMTMYKSIGELKSTIQFD